MEDAYIVDLYWQHNERAIEESASKYGRYCHSIAYNILFNAEDAEECVNDTYLGAWNSIPPHRPTVLSSFLGKITRRLSIKKWQSRNAKRRGGGEVALALEELADCVPASCEPDREVSEHELARIIDSFTASLPEIERNVFVCRYWYLDSIPSICRQFQFSQSKVKSMLYRTRKKLLLCLEEEGYDDYE